jgi:hypothetical protein
VAGVWSDRNGVRFTDSDIDMPGAVDGFELAKRIREHRPGLDVLLAGTVPRAVESAEDLCERGRCQNLTRRKSSIITFVVSSLVATLPENHNTDNYLFRKPRTLRPRNKGRAMVPERTCAILGAK